MTITEFQLKECFKENHIVSMNTATFNLREEMITARFIIKINNIIYQTELLTIKLVPTIFETVTIEVVKGYNYEIICEDYSKKYYENLY